MAEGRIRRRVARVVQGAELGAKSQGEVSPSDGVFRRGESEGTASDTSEAVVLSN